MSRWSIQKLLLPISHIHCRNLFLSTNASRWRQIKNGSGLKVDLAKARARKLEVPGPISYLHSISPRREARRACFIEKAPSRLLIRLSIYQSSGSKQQHIFTGLGSFGLDPKSSSSAQVKKNGLAPVLHRTYLCRWNFYVCGNCRKAFISFSCQWLPVEAIPRGGLVP